MENWGIMFPSLLNTQPGSALGVWDWGADCMCCLGCQLLAVSLGLPLVTCAPARHHSVYGRDGHMDLLAGPFVHCTHKQNWSLVRMVQY